MQLQGIVWWNAPSHVFKHDHRLLICETYVVYLLGDTGSIMWLKLCLHTPLSQEPFPSIRYVLGVHLLSHGIAAYTLYLMVKWALDKS